MRNQKCAVSNFDQNVGFSWDLMEDTQNKLHTGNPQYIADHPNTNSGISWGLYIGESTKIGDKSVLASKVQNKYGGFTA
jgi:predicted secreted protein